MNKKQKIQKLKRLIAFRLFGGKCFVCLKQYSTGFVFHHLSYGNDKKYYQFRNTDDYNEYIIQIIEKDDMRFVLLCTPCHSKLDHYKRGLTRWKNKHNAFRLLLVYIMTEKEK